MSPSVESDRPAPERAGSGPAPQAHPEAESPWTRIKGHKVLQWSLAYLGAALGLAHGQELLAHNFGWPEMVGHVLIGMLIVGFPIAVALAWYHGHRGMTRFSAPEMTVIALLLVIGGVLLTALIRVPGSKAKAVVQSSAAASAPAVITPPVTSAISASSKPRIAILPFENLSPDPANAFFTDGLYEEIIATLSNGAPGLQVISRTTMMTYRAAPKPMAAIAQELGATHVLEGSVRRDGDAVRLTLQLINARTDEHIWSQDYDRTLKDALTLQSQVARDVSSQLVEGFGGGASFKPLTRDPQAYDLYLKARLSFESFFRNDEAPVDALHDTVSSADAAIDRDPSFAAAMVIRMLGRLTLFDLGYDTSDNAVRLMRQDVEAAERLAPHDPLVLFGRGTFEQHVEFDAESALEAFQAADTAGYADPCSWVTTGAAFMAAGQLEEAVSRVQRAMTLCQGNPVASLMFMQLLQEARRPAQALRIAGALPPSFSARSYVIWQETGSAQALTQLLEAGRGSPTEGGASTFPLGALAFQLLSLRVRHRYHELIDRVNQLTVRTVRPGSDPGLEEWPVAELHGWAYLLVGDRTTAARDGREVLDFVAHVPQTRWNRTFLQLLAAEGSLFLGKGAQAQATVREALTAMPSILKGSADPIVVQVLAWSGATEEAVELLEPLATETPRMLSPADVVQDPLYAAPLAGNARYQALRAKLEAQMAATKLE